jgi:hypothetical protein
MSVIRKISEFNGSMPLIWSREGTPMSEPIVTLEATDDHLDHVAGLNTTLYPHQRTSLQALIDIETTRRIPLKAKLCINGINVLGPNPAITYNEAVFSDPVGSGKTIVMLALIMANRQPRRIAEIRQYNTPQQAVYTSYIKIKHAAIAPPTLIFVSRAILNQWIAAIKQFTKLRFFAVENAYSLRDFVKIARTKEINNYDIILIKNGTVSDQTKNIKAKSIYNQIADLGICWNRVVLDDYTNVAMSAETRPVRGVFTWYMAATRIYNRHRPSRESFPYQGSYDEYFKTAMISHTTIKCNEALFAMLNVRSSPEYIRQSIAMPHIKFWTIQVRDPNSRFIGMISAIGGDRAAAIGEMLSGDAIGEAAKAAGIEANSVADVFGQLLNKQYDAYRYAGDLLAYIEYVQQGARSRRPLSEWTDADNIREVKQGEIPRPLYGKKDLLEFKPIEFEYANIDALLKDAHAEYTEIKKNVGKAIERVKSRIDDGQCSVCYDQLSTRGDAVITKCCNAMFCGVCGFSAQGISRRSSLAGKCSNCLKSVKIEDLIYIASLEMLNKVKNEEFEESIEAPAIPAVVIPDEKKSKFDHIIDIIQSKTTIAERVSIRLPNIMNGSQFMPEPTKRKVLIFANFEETLKKVMEQLDKSKIKYYHLCGTTAQITELAAKFTADTEQCALVINSTQHCAGLNLQTATDLIFTHRILDNNIESQVAGRGHRIGRTSPLNIWYLTYESEHESLITERFMRPITPHELQLEAAPVSDLLVDQLEEAQAATPAKPAKPTKPIKKITHRVVRDSDSDD